MNVPRPEYPRPQMVREQWLNLNGPWQFEMDQSDSGRERGLAQSQHLGGTILVPFCPESELSGIGYRDFIRAVWYRRAFSIPPSWAGRHILLHFGAVDYLAEVWVNGQSAGCHEGGYTSFTLDITPYLREGENDLTLCAQDDLRRGRQAHGKQSKKLHSYECSYTRTTGIWQTVWLEPVNDDHIASFKLYSDIQNACLYIRAHLAGAGRGRVLQARAALDGSQVGQAQAAADGGDVFLRLPLSRLILWAPGQPVLYGLQLSLLTAGQETDRLDSYFGMRSVQVAGNLVLFNGRPLFQRLVLDQGFYPDGIYTAPSDAILRRDIDLAQALGFNGARLHQKVFEPRFLYWADRLGYLVWGEFGDTGLDLSGDDVLRWMLPQWQEAVERDYNSPALIVWCPLNEVRNGPWGAQLRPELIRQIYETTKRLDPTRPVVDASGFVHAKTDIFDVHEYEQNPSAFRRFFAPMRQGGGAYNTHPAAQKYEGQPYMVSEYGGTWWSPNFDPANQMSYGAKPATVEEFLQRFSALTGELLSNPAICGLCYTQLYDVEQEVNGLYTYAREAKFDPARIREALTARAAIEHPDVSC